MADASKKIKLLINEKTDAGGIRVEFNTCDDVTVCMNGKIQLQIAADASPAPRAGNEIQAESVPLQLGAPMEGRMKYVGQSPDTRRHLYVDEADAPGTYTFDEAKAYAAAHGKHLPVQSELKMLFNNRADIGGFDETGKSYWTISHSGPFTVTSQRFSDGRVDDYHPKDRKALLRCVL